PDRPQGTWQFGEGTIHHHAFDAGSADNQAALKDYIVGLGFTDVSDVKDRGYFFSVYCRTPGGALFEFAYSTPQGFTIDEAAAARIAACQAWPMASASGTADPRIAPIAAGPAPSRNARACAEARSRPNRAAPPRTNANDGANATAAASSAPPTPAAAYPTAD